ncbi:serine hydrolase domain-containing protein [Phenylobacterium sp.]|uniref:serine hydrolase domain-containing protein n=1 Tax=Phenylobacterium sp. TaxID=1871053 RepID=UPI00122050B3|nr:serine hydrolase domain-containing protein [Phenylobacterium sp.]TAL33397.1 MAG: class A beta-lactamase-related serine hydrolase [Phenylobacterium sp.]
MRSLGKAVLATLVLLVAPAAAQEAPLLKAPITQVAATAEPSTPPVRVIPGARLPVGQTIAPAELEAFVDGWMTDAMRREHVAGATVSVVQNGQVVLKKGYGFSNLEPRKPVDPDRTLFRIGSISKTFTWILLMKEVEAGRIRLDAPINLYLNEKVRLTGKSRDVTVRSLMEHTPGFEDRALGQLFERDPRRVRPLDLYLRQERPGRDRKPGLISSYSNYGVGLAGAAVTFGKGKTFERMVEDEITVPLGMNRTTFREPRPERRGLPAAMPQRLRSDISTGYSWRNAGFAANDYEYIGQVAPAGSASSTAGDMARYMLMLLGDGQWNGKTVFGPRAARAFRSQLRQTPDGVNGWAHGFMVFSLPGDFKGYGHGGDTLAFHSNMMVIPELGLGIFVSTNSENGAKLAGPLPESIVRYFYAKPEAFPRPGSAALARAGDLFDGAYLSTRRANGGLEGFVGLIAGSSEVEVTSGGRLITRSPLGDERAWVPDGPVAEGRFISTLGDSRLMFHMEQGRAVSYRGAINAQTEKRAPFTERLSTLTWMAGLTLFAALANFAGLALRNRREVRQNQIQARAAIVQTMQAGLWLASFVLFGLWASGASDIQALMYDFPGLLLVTASASALVASALGLLTIAALLSVWQGGRRVDSWSASRKTFFTISVLIYTAFSVLLAMNGALEPWSS